MRDAIRLGHNTIAIHRSVRDFTEDNLRAAGKLLDASRATQPSAKARAVRCTPFAVRALPSKALVDTSTVLDLPGFLQRRGRP